MAGYLIKDNILAHNDQQPEAVAKFEWAEAQRFPLITICWGEDDFLKVMAEKCDHPKHVTELNFHQILRSCLSANMTPSTILNMTGIGTWQWDVDTHELNWIDIMPFNGNSYFKTDVRGQWSKLIHPKLGPCYTFEIDKLNQIKEIFIDILLHYNYSKSITFSNAG